MGEEHTQNIPDSRSFEERVFARFDSLDSRLDSMDSRLDAVESHLERMDSRVQTREDDTQHESIETKPIWERALSQLEELTKEFRDFRVEVRDAFRDLSSKIDVLGSDMIQLRANHIHLETRLCKLESEFQR